MADDNVKITFGATIDGAIADINKITEKLEYFGAHVEGLAGPLKAVGEAVIAAFAVEKIEQWTEKIVDVGVDLAKMEAQTGLAAQEINVLKYATDGSDTELTLLTRTMTQFARIAEEAKDGTSQAARAFSTLGIDVKAMLDSGKTLNDVWDVTIKKLDQYKDGLNKSSLEATLLGGRSTQLSLAIKKLAENSGEMNAAVLRSGVTIKGLEEASMDTKDKMLEAGDATRGFGERLFLALKPAIDSVADAWATLMELFNKTLLGGILFSAVKLLATAFADVVEVIALLGQTSLLVWAALEQAVDKAKFSIIGTTLELRKLYDELTHNKQGVAELDIEIAKNEKAWADAKKESDAYGVATAQKIKDILSNLLDLNKEMDKSGEKTDAPPTKADPKAAMDADIAAHKAALEEELALVGQNLQARMILQQQYYDWLRQKYPQDANALASAGKQIAQTQNQEAKQSEASWNRFFNGFNSGIMGMLRGTTTFKQALQNMFGNVVEFALKAIEKMVAHWIGSEITKTAATNAGNAARISSDIAGAAASKAAQKAADSTSVMSSAKTAAAGAYSATAAIPIIGPILAPAAAAVAFGATMAFDSFETGTPYVPKTGPYILHEGEEVRPAGVQSAGGGGGVHFHVSAMDSKSVAQFFETHGSAIAKQVTEQFKRGNSTFRPRS